MAKKAKKKAKKKVAKKSAAKSGKKGRKTVKKFAKKAVKKASPKKAPKKKAKAAKRKKPATLTDKISGAYHTVVDSITGTDTLRNKMSKTGASESE
jgi:hypothetical protein